MRPIRMAALLGGAVALSAACGLEIEGARTPAVDGADASTTDASEDRSIGEMSTDGDVLVNPDAAVADAADGGDAADAEDTIDIDAGDAGAVSALSFDGTDDFVRVLRQVQSDFTLEAWIKTSTSRSGSNFFDGLGLVYADVSGSAADFGTSILNGKFAFGTVDNTIQSATTVTTGTWVHVAAVRIRSSGTMRVLVNGVQETSTTGNSTALLNAPATIDIGGNTIDDRYFKGLIDEVRIWSVARSAAEITGTMKKRLKGNEAGLVGYWRFDDGTGTVATDSTASSNDGVLGSGTAAAVPTWVSSNAF